MPTNITDVDTFTDPVVGPAAGDPRTALSVVTMGQGLANRTRNHKNRLDGAAFKTVTSTKPDTDAGAETSSLIHQMGQSATTRFWLLQSSTINAVAARMRIYQDATQNGGYAFTYNAAWDADTDQWVKDNTSIASTKYGIGASGGYTLQFFPAGSTGPFAEASWDANVLALGHDGVRTLLALTGALPTSSAPGANALYANNIVKAWAHIEVVSGAITVRDAFNVDTASVSISGSNILIVPFRTALGNAWYSTTATSKSATDFVYMTSQLTTQVALQLINSLTQAATDLTATTRTIMVHCVGQ